MSSNNHLLFLLVKLSDVLILSSILKYSNAMLISQSINTTSLTLSPSPGKVPHKSFNVNVMPSGNWSKTISDLSIFELLILNKFHEKVSTSLHNNQSESNFFRSTPNQMNWLIANNWNLDQASKGYSKSSMWRENNQVDRLANETVDEEMLNAFYYEIRGRDKQGCPLLIVPLGEWRTPRSFLAKTKSAADAFTKMRMHFIGMLESVMNFMHRYPSSCSQFVLIFDLDGFTQIHSIGGSLFKRLIEVLQQNYPNSLKLAYFINGTPSFMKMMNIISPSMDNKLRDKIYLYTEKMASETALLQNIPAKELSFRYGGDDFAAF